MSGCTQILLRYLTTPGCPSCSLSKNSPDFTHGVQMTSEREYHSACDKDCIGLEFERHETGLMRGYD